MSFLITLTALSGHATAEEPVVIRFGGDVLLAEHYETAAGEDSGMGLRRLGLLESADLAMVNLENPITTRGSKREKPYTFRMHPRYISTLSEGGVDVVNLANNHIYDYDSTGLFDTIRYLDSAGIAHVGAGSHRAQAHRPVIRTIRGITVALLGYYQGGEAPAATETGAGVALRTLDLIARDIRMVEKQTDYIVINFHWGKEKAQVPEREHVDFAHAVIDLGADVIVGHHPHVLQGIEEYNGGLIAYSLGNLVFGGNSRREEDTVLLELRLTQTGFIHDLLPVRVRDWVAEPLQGPAGDAVAEMVRRLPISDPLAQEK